MEHFSNIAVVVLAAGKGKRMNNPNLAKVMALLGGKPLIHYVIDQVMVLDPSDILLVVGFQKQSIIDYIDGLSIPYLKFVEQTEQLGTGHAVAQAQSVLDGFAGDVLILAGDVPLITADTLQKFIYKHRTDQADISVLTAIVPEPTGYGRIIRNDIGEFLKITEEKDATDDERLINEVNSGIIVAKAKKLFPALNLLRNNNSQGEYYLTDAIEILLKSGSIVKAYSNASFEELQGINTIEDLKKAEDYLNIKNLQDQNA